MSTRAGRAVIWTALLVSMWACSQAGRREQMTVELDVFSGRPNPQWALTETQATQVEELLRALPKGEERMEPGLGYRGFMLKDGRRRIEVGSGIVRIEKQVYLDAKGLEAYLRRLAEEQGYKELMPGNQ